MSDPEIYMVLKDKERSPARKQRSSKVTEVVSITVAAILIIAVLGYFLYFKGPANRSEEPGDFKFAINTKWTSHFNNYIITFENRTNGEDIEVVLDNDLERRTVNKENIQSINRNQFLVSPGFPHSEDKNITIEVFKKGALMGTRTIKPMAMDWDLTTVGDEYEYDFFYSVDKRTHDGSERITREMEGELSAENSDGGILSNFTGRGTTRIESRSSDPNQEFNMDLTIHIEEYSSSTFLKEDKTTLVSEMESGTGEGSGFFDIEDEGEISADLEVTEYLRVVTDNNLTDTRMKASGTFDGTFTGTIDMETYKTGEEIHDNYLGINYPCLVVEGSTKIKADQGPVPIYINSRQKIWNVKSLDFSYPSIYYEINYTVSGQSSGEESGYIEDAPQPANLTIADVITMKGFIPSELMSNDSFTLSSRYGYEVSYTVTYIESPPSNDVLSGTSITLEGEVIKGGIGNDLQLLVMTKENSFTQVERHFSFSWIDEFISVNMTRGR